MEILKLCNIEKRFTSLDEPLFSNVNLNIYGGESISIMGASGSGKSTLLKIASLLMKADKGSIFINDQKLDKLSEKEICKIRNEEFGFIFQNNTLMQEWNVLENILLPVYISSKDERSAKKRAAELLELVGLGGFEKRSIKNLSGGEKQRVSIARSLIMNPKIVFADEPTGALDEKNGEAVCSLLFGSVVKNISSLLIVTHNPLVAQKADKHLLLKNGNLIGE